MEVTGRGVEATGQRDPRRGETPRPPPPRRRRGGDGRTPRRWLVRLGVWGGGVWTLSATASAHGTLHSSGAPVASAVVVGLPVVAGLLGGAVGIWHGRRTHRVEGRRSRFALGVLLLVLATAFAGTALARSPPVAVTGGTAGLVAAALVARRETASGRASPGHAHLTLGAIGGHRALEGVALGALASSGALVGLVGATAVAGHTALETVAVGGVYAARRSRAVVAVVLVQVSYVAGAAAGVVVAGAVPGLVRVGALSLAAGVLLALGVIETRRSFTLGRGARPDGERVTRGDRVTRPEGRSEAETAHTE